MKENNKSQTVTAQILLAHGSKDPRWRKSFEDLLEKSRKSSPKKKLPLLSGDMQTQSEQAVKDLADSNFKISTINIHSIFLSAGVHFNEDIKAMVSDLQATYPNLKFKINDVVSNNSIVSNAILKVVTS